MHSLSTRTALHDIDVHFLHVPGKGPNPCPLLLMHGWPGSVFEFLDLIPRLTDPASFGGDPADAFTVVAPSLPGYGLSFRPGQKRFGIEEIADCLADLMTETLGYRPLRRAGRRLGRHHGVAHGLRARGEADRHPCQPAGGAPRAQHAVQPDTRGAQVPRRAGSLAEGGDRLSVDSGDAAADAEFWSDRLARGVGRLDRREIPGLVGLRRRCGERVHARSVAGQYQPLLVHRRDRLLVLPVLLPHASALADPGRRQHRRADRLCRVSARNPACAAIARRANLHRHPPLDASCRAAATSRRWNSRRRWPARSRRSSDHCAETVRTAARRKDP